MRLLNCNDIDNQYEYDGHLGVVHYEGHTHFRTWAPLATGVYLNLYLDGEGNNKIETVPLERRENGVWFVEIMREIDGDFYTYTYEYDNCRKTETIDIYANACGVNGKRGAVLKFERTNPEGWETSERVNCRKPTDAVIYELHVKDFSVNPNSRIPKYERGKFSAFSVDGTYFDDISTCLEHLKELGVTHVQLLPIYDYCTVDESKNDDSQYNWGYDPANYFCLEGSYSSNPYNPYVRIREFKELVMTLHNNGIGVIMDVVFNHTKETEQSAFEKTFSGYYYRLNPDGNFSNASGCGNEIASEHKMVRKYICDCVKFWATEYKLDGFRFDLMAVLDIETLKLIRSELDKIDPRILMYGEGWTGGMPALSGERLGFKHNSYNFPEIGLFNDTFRDSIKGGTFDSYSRGFIGQNFHVVNYINRGMAGSCEHTQLPNNKDGCFAFNPSQTINYCEAHDNHTLWDKLSICAKNETEEERIAMDKMAGAMVILAQGVPFIHAGQDFLRSKPRVPKEGEPVNELTTVDENSYNAPVSTNGIDWSRKEKYIDVFNYYKALIALRKRYPHFRYAMRDEVERHVRFTNGGDNNIVCYTITDTLDEQEISLFVALNPYKEEKYVRFPEGGYVTELDENGQENPSVLYGGTNTPPVSVIVYRRVN